jgi:Ribbon-helix-helix protein, copG family
MHTRCQTCTLVSAPKKPRPPIPRGKKRRPDPHAPIRRSIYLDRQLFAEITAQAKAEERKSSDMIRVLLRRGLTTTRGPTGTG